MQKLTDQVVVQLNDLPGFPARPNTNPPAPDRWVLGDWLVECHVNPEVANAAALPLTGNRVGDVRASLADQLWYIWDGAAWQPMAGGGGAVAAVTASAPLASSGGANPNISFPTWPANAVGALTNDGAGNLSWSPAGGGTITGSGTATQLAYFTGASAISSETAVGTDALTWDAAGNVLGVRTASPTAGAALDVASGQVAVPGVTAGASAAAPSVAFRDDMNTGLFSPAANILGISTDGSEVARIYQVAGDPLLLMGTSTVLANITVDSPDPEHRAGVALIGHGGPAIPPKSESLNGGQFAGVRTRGTKAAPTAVSTDDGLWCGLGVGYTSGATPVGGYNYGALITFKAEEAYTPTASGGRIEFHTTLNGTDGYSTLGSAPTERMRITNAGNVGIGSAAPVSLLSVGSTSQFQVSSIGDIVSIRGQTTTFPAANAAGVLTNNGAGTLSWSAPSTSSSTIDIPATAQEPLAAGDLVRFVDDAGVPKVQKADATNAAVPPRLNPVGFATTAAAAGASVTVRIAGIVDVPAALFDAAPGPANVGQRVFVSTTSGQVTLTAPTAVGDILQRAGVLVDGSANPKVLVQIGDPILL